MIRISLDSVATVTANLQARSDKLQLAMVRAINRSIGSVRTVMVREIARNLSLKQKIVRDALTMRQATVQRPEASLGASLKKMKLFDFSAKGPYPSRGKGGGVTYKLTGITGRIPNAFIATMPSGHPGVFVRKAKARLGIRELEGVSLGHVFGKFRPMGIARGREVLVSNLQHEIDRVGGDESVEVADADVSEQG